MGGERPCAAAARPDRRGLRRFALTSMRVHLHSGGTMRVHVRMRMHVQARGSTTLETLRFACGRPAVDGPEEAETNVRCGHTGLSSHARSALAAHADSHSHTHTRTLTLTLAHSHSHSAGVCRRRVVQALHRRSLTSARRRGRARAATCITADTNPTCIDPILGPHRDLTETRLQRLVFRRQARGALPRRDPHG